MAQYLHNAAFDINKHPATLEDFFNFLVTVDTNSTILVLPTKKYVEKAKKEFIKYNFKINNTPTSELLFFTLQEFSILCYEKLFSDEGKKTDLQLINDAMTLFFIESAISEIENLEYYNKKNISFSIVKKIASVITGLKEDGITIDKMQDENTFEEGAYKVSNASYRFNDLCKIYSAYEKKISGKYLDKTDVYYNIVKNIKASNSNTAKSFPIADSVNNFVLDKHFENIKLILFYGFTDFKQPEVDFISTFVLSEIPVVINIPYSQIEGPNIDLLPDNMRRLVSHWFNQTSTDLISKTSNIFQKNTTVAPSQHIRRFLFDEKKHISKINIPQIEIFEAENRVEEVKTLSNLIHYLHKKEKIELSNICICSRNPNSYAELFREFFSESGIPINVSDRFELSTSAPVVSIINILEFLTNNLTYNNLVKLSNISYVQKKVKNIKKLINVLNKYKLYSYNQSQKNKKWEHIEDKLKIYISNYYEQCSDNRFEEDAYYIKSNIEELEEAQEIFAELKKYFNLKEKLTYTYAEFNELIKKNIIEKLEIAENIFLKYKEFFNKNNNLENYQLTEEIEKNASALVKFIKVLDEFTDIGNKENVGEKYSLDYLIEKLKIVVSIEKYQIREKYEIGVNITSIEQTRGIPYEVIILCGAVENEFPLKFQTDTFLGKELHDSENRHYNGEKMLFQQFLANNIQLFDQNKQKVFIFYPKKNNNIELIPSPYINNLINISTNLSVKKISELTSANKKEFEWLFYRSQLSDILEFTASEKNLSLTSNKNNLILPEIDKSKNYSITELETYASCPFQYFVRYIAKIKSEEDYSEFLNKIEIGDFLHRILEKFYLQNIKDSTKKIETFTTFDILERNKKEKYWGELKKIAEKELRQYDTPIYKYDIKRIVDDNGVLAVWLENEIVKFEKSNWEYSSVFFEKKIGDKNNGVALTLQDEQLGEAHIKIHGKIDRVEIKKDAKSFLIADYKTSHKSVPSIKKIERGESLQIPIYLLALEEMYKDYNWVATAGVYYILEKEVETNKAHKEFCFQDKYGPLLEASLKSAIKYKQSIENRNFEANKCERCNYCLLKTICRVDKN